MSKSSKTKCKKINSRYVVTFVAAFLLILLYFMVFGFSAQDAEQSGSLSHMISEKCVEWINALSENIGLMQSDKTLPIILNIRFANWHISRSTPLWEF